MPLYTRVASLRNRSSSGIPVLVEAERLRPHLETLLEEANYVTTSAKFPQVGHRQDPCRKRKRLEMSLGRHLCSLNHSFKVAVQSDISGLVRDSQFFVSC